MTGEEYDHHEVYDRDLIDMLCRRVIGTPSATWQDLIYVRDVVDELLNDEVNRRQREAT